MQNLRLAPTYVYIVVMTIVLWLRMKARLPAEKPENISKSKYMLFRQNRPASLIIAWYVCGAAVLNDLILGGYLRSCIS